MHQVVVEHAGYLLGEAMAKKIDRVLARSFLYLDGWKTYERHGVLYGITGDRVRMRYDDEAGKWVER